MIYLKGIVASVMRIVDVHLVNLFLYFSCTFMLIAHFGTFACTFMVIAQFGTHLLAHSC